MPDSQEYMQAGEPGQSDIIKSMLKEAEVEAERIEQEAEKAIKERLEACGDECRRIEEEGKRTAEEKIATILTRAKAAAALSNRRELLRMRETIIGEIIGSVEKRFSELIGRSGYVEVLSALIAEAVVGLDADEALIQTSAPEKVMLDKAIPMAREKAQELLGRPVALGTSTEATLHEQGIILTKSGGSVAFNNQVSTRLLRYQTEIRKLIHERLFSED